ncbi:hypothetical protein SMD20_03345 [Nonomuraea sp. LP-02]|uniref:hypothetical protein n=1 Tax=Nonomuraea sp. LP-02 TaxID=3097960 RepID=UPI002E334A28|nr:hypothetical protein [Nonomuraea sp. LP-02]MED7923251.1 hypothetical protein [Nonomuraea sp. LP-02]
MSEMPYELPEAVGGVDGESDVVAERSSCGTPRNRRPVSADMPQDLDPPHPYEEPEENEEDVTRPDIGPTG